MMYKDPSWVNWLSRKIPFFALDNMALYLIVLQVFGFIVYMTKPEMITNLYLVPGLVMSGEVWRLFTFLAVPMDGNFIFMAIFLVFLYFIVSNLEAQWGAFRLTLYLAIAILFTILFSFLFNYPVRTFGDIEISLFLAMAMLNPSTEILLFFIFPVKMIYIAIVTAGFLLLRIIFADSNLDRLYFLFVYLNYLLFFGVYHYGQIQSWWRARQYKQNNRR